MTTIIRISPEALDAGRYGTVRRASGWCEPDDSILEPSSAAEQQPDSACRYTPAWVTVSATVC